MNLSAQSRGRHPRVAYIAHRAPLGIAGPASHCNGHLLSTSVVLAISDLGYHKLELKHILKSKGKSHHPNQPAFAKQNQF